MGRPRKVQIQKVSKSVAQQTKELKVLMQVSFNPEIYNHIMKQAVELNVSMSSYVNMKMAEIVEQLEGIELDKTTKKLNRKARQRYIDELEGN